MFVTYAHRNDPTGQRMRQAKLDMHLGGADPYKVVKGTIPAGVSLGSALETENYMLDKLLKEIERLKRGNDLLERVYAELDPYQGGTIAPGSEILYALQNHFKFDDSE